jgi:hypothetical protein
MNARALVPLLLLAACATRGWSVSTPKQITALPTDAIYAFPVLVVQGGVLPGSVETVEARCADPAICEARVVPLQSKRGRPAVREVQVIGKQPGTTKLVVDAENPIYHDHERHTVAVAVTAPPSRTAIALGSPPPHGSDFIHRQGDVDVGRCTLATGYTGNVYGGDRPDVGVYACSPYADIDAQRRFRICGDGLCGNDDSYLLCTQARDGAIAATSILSYGANGFEAKSTDGSFDDRACEPRK